MRKVVGFEWDERKARAKQRKHRVDFADAATIFEDDRPVTVAENDPAGRALHYAWHGCLGQGPGGRLCDERRTHQDHFCAASHQARARRVRTRFMKRESNFSNGKRGAVIPSEPGKTRITIRLDNEILDHFRKQFTRWVVAITRLSSMMHCASTFGAATSRRPCAEQYEKN